jgi:hypothetical protein
MSCRHAAVAALAGLVALLGGCAAGPSYPLLTPVEIAHDFGFSETRLPDGRYEVSYVAPTQEGIGYRFDQSPAERQSKALAYDMALWRAAQIAQAQGYQGFSVADSKSNSDVQQRAGYYDGPYGPGWGPGPNWGWGGGGWGRGGFGGGWGDYYNPPQTSVQVQVKLAVTLSNSLKPGDYNAAAAIQQLRQTYPGADGGVAVPPSPAIPGTVAPIPGATVTPVPALVPATPKT